MNSKHTRSVVNPTNWGQYTGSTFHGKKGFSIRGGAAWLVFDMLRMRMNGIFYDNGISGAISGAFSGSYSSTYRSIIGPRSIFSTSLILEPLFIRPHTLSFLREDILLFVVLHSIWLSKYVSYPNRCC